MNNQEYLKSFISAIILLLIVAGCNLEKDVDIDLPQHDSQLVVECYLEPGKQVALLLTESASYLAPPALPFVNDALVTVTYDNITDTFRLNPVLDENQFKVYNYYSRRVVPKDYEKEFVLNIKDSKGRTVTGSTKLLPAVPIQKLEYRYNKDSLAYILVTFSDDKTQDNYYRFVAHKDSLRNVIQRFALTDDLAETSNISVGTQIIFEKGDTAFLTLYHIEKSYYDYLQTIEAARDANFNPFAQPAMIKSNVKGGIGIFTGLAYDTKVIVIK